MKIIVNLLLSRLKKEKKNTGFQDAFIMNLTYFQRVKTVTTLLLKSVSNKKCCTSKKIFCLNFLCTLCSIRNKMINFFTIYFTYILGDSNT